MNKIGEPCEKLDGHYAKLKDISRCCDVSFEELFIKYKKK